MKRLIVLLGLSMLIFSGCASIICTSEKTININSHPPGAKFIISNPEKTIIVEGITPANVTLKRGRGYFTAGDYTIKFSKPGYESMDLSIQQGLETGWYFGGNFVFGGLIGVLFVDPLTGAMWNIEDKSVVMIPIPNYKPTPAINGVQTGENPIGYKATIDPRTGKVEITPVY